MESMNYKNLTKSELDSFFTSIEFKTPLWKHQLASLAFALGSKLNRVMFLHDIGIGKTLLALSLLQCWNPKNKILIFLRSVWTPC